MMYLIPDVLFHLNSSYNVSKFIYFFMSTFTVHHIDTPSICKCIYTVYTTTVLIFQAMAISEQIGYPDHILEEENKKLEEEYTHV